MKKLLAILAVTALALLASCGAKTEITTVETDLPVEETTTTDETTADEAAEVAPTTEETTTVEVTASGVTTEGTTTVEVVTE